MTEFMRRPWGKNESESETKNNINNDEEKFNLSHVFSHGI